jgi:hypothetical protein
MKKLLTAFLTAFLLASCSSPVLKWIDTPDGGTEGRISGNSADKEIISFSFGIEGETVLPFGRNPDSTGKIPISVILPTGSSANALRPVITFIGKSLTPPSGEAGDFTSPVVYTVTAEDGTTRDYIVKVSVKTEDSKAIIRFALDVSGTGDSALSAEGIIDEEAGTIIVSVPAGTDIRSMNAHITHTGVSVTGPLGNPHPDETFDFNGNFSAPTTWTVIAQNHTTKTYTVTVVREKSHDKEITHFSLGIPGENDIIGGEPQPDGKYPILAIVPETTGQVNLTQVAPFISYTGAAISPGPVTELDFSDPVRPVPYTVTAEDRSTRDYVVTVIRKDNSFDSLAQITGFYFIDPLVEGVIDEAAKTITLTVPAGTDLSALRPEIYYIGDSVSPKDGQAMDFTGSNTTPVIYKVRSRNGEKIQSYEVSVFPLAVPIAPKIDIPGTDGEKVDVGTDANGNYTIIVELPVFINNPVININYGENAGGFGTQSQTETITNNNVFNNITVAGDDYEYNIVVINPPSDTPPNAPNNTASIDGFYFVSPLAVGTIGTTGAGTPADPIPIMVTVPYGTNLRSLAATVCYTGKEIAGIPGPNPLKDNARSFTDPVGYTVNAQDGTSSKTYRVTVTVAPNNAKEITDFSFEGVTSTSAMISAVPNAEGTVAFPIVVTVPDGTNLGNLTPVITHTGKDIASVTNPGNTFSGTNPVRESSPVDFSGADISSANPVVPVTYTVTAEDGSTRTYAVTVRKATSLEENIEITGFYFPEPLAVGLVNQNANTITVTVPSKTNTASLKPTVYFKGLSVKPGSGAVNNFSGPVTYTVTGNSGKTRAYTVTVNSTPSSTKDITRFNFPGISNTETVIGAVPNTDGTYPISVWVPAGTDLGNLGLPDITYTGVSVTTAGGTPGDPGNPPTYTITAEDGSEKTYTVTVNAQSGGTKLITSLVFNEIPLEGGGSVRVVASIDQTGHTITAEVPFAANISALKPTLTWIGRSITGPGGGDQTANPFTDTSRNFSGPQTYTVKDQNGAGLPYSVSVIRKSPITVNFTGETDRTIIADNGFDQTTGVITITVNTTNVDPPYEWYLDGVKQPVPNTQTSFTLSVGDGTFIPGRHEIMVSGKKGGLHYTGKVYFTVSGGTK